MSDPVPLRWTEWRPLEPGLCVTPASLAEIVDGGQSFRWWPRAEGSWIGQWSEHVIELRSHPGTTLEWRCPADQDDLIRDALPRYLGLDQRHVAAMRALPWRSDPHLRRAMDAFPGLRLLRQPFGETLLTFLCSATKQIVQIKQMVALLAQRLGRPVSTCHSISDTLPGGLGWRLPTWEELANVSEVRLRDCLLGFRARYIRETAVFLASHPDWLEETRRLPYVDAKARLCELPGVGEKVADCVLLFGGGKDEAFPVDVWILKAMARRYGLEKWSPQHVAHFGRVHFGAYAGLAQQFLFAFERAAARAR